MARQASENREEAESWERLEAQARDLIELIELAGEDEELDAQVRQEARALEVELQQRS